MTVLFYGRLRTVSLKYEIFKINKIMAKICVVPIYFTKHISVFIRLLKCKTVFKYNVQHANTYHHN